MVRGNPDDREGTMVLVIVLVALFIGSMLVFMLY